MTKHILQIVEGAYRVTVEEQDDPVLWVTQAMHGAGGKFSVLLRGNAVNYAVKAQDASGLKVGAWHQTQPPKPQEDLQRLLDKGVDVYFVEEDVAERGLELGELVDGMKPVSRPGLAALVGRFDMVWHW